MKNPLFRKQGLDALLEELNQSDGMGRVPDPGYDGRLYGKGTELESNRTPQISIPPSDLKQAKAGDLVEEFSGILDRYGYRLTGPRSDGSTLWMRGPNERVLLDKDGNWTHRKNNIQDLSGTWRELEDKMDNYHEFTRTLVTASAEFLYHVTHTKLVPKIKKQGILPMQTSNWSMGGDDGHYGDGWIFAFDHEMDAIRWAAKMDWEFNQKIGSGKISILTLDKGEGWEPDIADPMSQAGTKGNWLKRFKAIPPQEIKSAAILTPEMVKKVILKAPEMEEEKEAATKSYGTGTPLGGTPNTPQQWNEEGEEETTDKQAGKFKAELLRKADVGMHTTPPLGTPREDQRRHVDEDLKNEMEKENGVNEPKGMPSFRQFGKSKGSIV